MKEELRAMRAELQEVSSYQRDFSRLPTSSAGPSVSAGGYSTTSTNESAGGLLPTCRVVLAHLLICHVTLLLIHLPSRQLLEKSLVSRWYIVNKT